MALWLAVWLSLTPFGAHRLSLALYCSPNLLTKPLLGSHGPCSAHKALARVTPYIAYLRIARLRTSFLSSSTLISPSLAFLHFLNYGCDPYLSYFQNKQSIAGKDETTSTLLPKKSSFIFLLFYQVPQTLVAIG